MTAFVKAHLYCDACGKDYDEDHASATVTGIRSEAARYGWSRTRVDRKRFDVCPAHAGARFVRVGDELTVKPSARPSAGPS